MTPLEKYLSCIANLLWELATELDIHYDDSEYHALADTYKKMKVCVDLLEAESTEVPESVHRIMAKIQRSLQ